MKYIMKTPVLILLFIIIVVLFIVYFKRQDQIRVTMQTENLKSFSTTIKENLLTPAQYKILKEGGTEIPFTSPLLHEKRKGTYVTADCNEPVFRSEQKFDSETGWPSFYAPINKEAVIEKIDIMIGISRTEIISPICKSHLGHVFNDAPQTPTGLRYCINGLALIFIPDKIQ